MHQLLDHMRLTWEKARRKIRNLLEPFLRFQQKHPRALPIVLVTVLGIGAILQPVLATCNITDSTCTAQNWVIGLINDLLYAIAGLMVGLNMLLSWLMIDFAKYNVFVTAQPVLLGWPLVRDVVNMFFIVVLLVVAFSTIIGYQKFHYKGVLPKLLLMAVLINFSKTLVGIMIDFSQVLTLTFVNGFQAAAFGNLVKAFNLTNVLSIASDQAAVATAAGTGGQTPGQVLISLVFGIAILSITGTILLIMAIYFAVRIVLLWVLLIFAPIAFFAYGLPPSLTKAISPLTDGWWSRLGSMLSGGPIVAFFLWLTLAVIQGSSNPFPGLYQSQSATEEASLNPVITKVGTPSNITTMMVAIIMLMSGLTTAIKISGEAAPQLGKLAQDIKASGGPATVLGRYAWRGASYTARKGAGAVDRRANLSGRAGNLALRAGQAIGRVPVIRAAAPIFTRAGAGLTGIGAAERAETIGAFQKRYKHLNPAQRLQALDGEIGAVRGITGDPRALQALEVQKGLLMKEGSSLKARSAKYEAEYLAIPRGTDSEEVHKMKAKAYGETKATREAAIAVSDAAKSAEAGGDDENATKLKDAQSKQPSFYADMKQLSGVASKSIDDHKQLDRDVKTQAWQDNATFLAYMKATGLVTDDGKRAAITDKNREAWEHLTKYPNSDRAKYINAHMAQLDTEDGGKVAAATLAVMSGTATKEQEKLATEGRYYASIDKGNTILTQYGNIGDDLSAARQRFVPAAAPVAAPTRPESFQQLVGGNAQYQVQVEAVVPANRREEFARGFSAPITAQQVQHITNNQQIYANPPAAPNVAQVRIAMQGQAMGVPVPPEMRQQVLAEAVNLGDSGNIQDQLRGAGAIANINPKDIIDSAQIQEAVTNAMSGQVEKIEKLYKASSADPTTMKKMEEVLKAVSTVGKGAAAKAAGGQSLSAIEAKLAEIESKIVDSKELRRIVRPGEQKKKKNK